MKLSTVVTLAALTVAALLPLAARSAEADTRLPHPPKPPFPQITLPDAASNGARAVSLLGTQLPEVAAWYGKSAEEFRNLLLRDKSLKLDRRGRLFVVDELAAPLPAPTPAQQSISDGNLLPLDQTFLLHSRPGAQRTIYLNFRGATLSGTAWNGTTSITALPFDLDGLPYSNSTAELQRIQAIWQRVAEDYAPFDVNVTTEPPPADALTRSSSTDQVFGTTVLITNSNGVYSCSCGGVAYLGVFDDTSNFYKPALVFYNQLGGGHEKYVAEAISHEAGHNMGLGHDGYSGGTYYSGHGSGPTGWAPIMGAGYYQALVQWSKGQYSTATNTQDDVVVMQSNGLPLRADDHGNTAATATLLTGSAAGGSTTYTAQGVIERPTDVDMFSFVAAAGSVSVGLNPAARSANLDALVELRNAAGQVLASANPADGLAAALSFVVPTAGTYYVSVQGVGKGDPLGVGYTNYGSLGNYALQVTALTASGQPPFASLTAAPVTGTAPLTTTFSGAGSSDPDGSIVSYEWTFGDGGTAVGATVGHVYETAGTYTAQLRVTDNSGLSATSSVTVVVSPVVTVLPMRVADIAMTLASNGNNRFRANAAVKLVDSQGRPVVGATVTGRWSGVVSGNATGTTNSSGVVSFASANTRNRGTFTFTVGGATLANYRYDATLNTETSDSISR